MCSGVAKGSWTYDGKIYLRRNDGKKLTVRYEEDLHKLNQESARINLDIDLAPIVEVVIRTRSSVTHQ